MVFSLLSDACEWTGGEYSQRVRRECGGRESTRTAASRGLQRRLPLNGNSSISV
jgi:hypothetical protein